MLAANELNFTPKMFGGAMIGLQSTALKNKLKSRLNGIVNYETWVPSPKLLAPAAEFFKKYQERAAAEGVDPLGSSLGGFGYAYVEILGEAIEGTTSLDDSKLADYLRSHEFHTIMADIKFGSNGEWTQSRMMQVQYHDIPETADIATWKGMNHQTVLTPPDQKRATSFIPTKRPNRRACVILRRR